MSKEDLWTLVHATSRLRLAAHTLAALRTETPVSEGDFTGACLPLEGSDEYAGAPACVGLRMGAAGLAGFYEAIADEIDQRGSGPLAPVPPPAMIGPAIPKKGAGAPRAISPAHELPHPHLLWVQENLHHLSTSAQMVSEPALHLAEIRQRPWWR
jgi:hypothetical protein